MDEMEVKMVSIRDHRERGGSKLRAAMVFEENCQQTHVHDLSCFPHRSWKSKHHQLQTTGPGAS